MGQPIAPIALFHRNDDRHALLNIKDILVGLALGRDLFLFRIAVQIEHPDAVECVQQMPAHAPECRIVQIAVIGDKAQDPLAILFDQVRGHADEFHIKIVQPFGIALLQLFAPARLFLVILHQRADPAFGYAPLAQIRRVPDHAHDRHIALDGVGLPHLV